MADTPVTLLRAHARHSPWNARGLAAPSARSVRFYVSHGLLDRPEGAGTAATYGYRHFLQLLAIKIRQREGQTLETIKREMKDMTGDALERRIAQSLAPALVANPVSPAAEDDSPVSWRRMSVAEGVELHVRGDSPSSNEQALIAMREAVRAALGRQELR